MSAALAALAEPTRQSLLDLLAEQGEASATAAAEELPVSRQAIVKHLAVLERARLVASRPRGREVLYAVRPERVEEAAAWLSSLAATWDARLRRLKDLAEGEDPGRPGSRRPPARQERP